MNARTKPIVPYQVLNDQKGDPEYAVVPIHEFMELLELHKFDNSITLPNDVVRKHSIEGMSLLRAWREHFHLTQDDLAKSLGVSQSTIAQHENPHARPQKNTLAKWASALGIDVEQLRI